MTDEHAPAGRVPASGSPAPDGTGAEAAPPSATEVIARLEARSDPDNVAGMASYGINPTGALGVSVPGLRAMAKELKKSDPDARHELAGELWRSAVHEARMLAGFVDVPALVTEDQMDEWAGDFDSWDICDQVCGNLFDKTPFAYDKAELWAQRSEEFVKRAGFALVTQLAVHDKAAADEAFERFLPIIEREAFDERNFVKKAVNWALRQVGKRNLRLNALAIETGERIVQQPSKAARWVATDALRELRSDAVQERLKGR